MQRFVVPLATIIVVVVLFIIISLIAQRVRRRNQQEFFSHNSIVPNQSTNTQLQRPIHLTQRPSTYLGNSIPARQPFPVTSFMPVPQPFLPTIPTQDPTPSPDPPTQNLKDRMRQVQSLMVEIHRLENEGGDRNTQRIHELKQRVVELSNSDEHDPLRVPPDLFPQSGPPPPAYLPRE